MDIFNTNSSSKKFNTSLPIQTGWTPLIAWIEVSTGQYVIKIVDWTGGINNKPEITNVYLGEGELVSEVANAIIFGTGSYSDSQAIAAIRSLVIDDTKGNGDTGFVWSADKTFDITDALESRVAINEGDISSVTSDFSTHNSSVSEHGLVSPTSWVDIISDFELNWTGSISWYTDKLDQIHLIVNNTSFAGAISAGTGVNIIDLSALIPLPDKAQYFTAFLNETSTNYLRVGRLRLSITGILSFSPGDSDDYATGEIITSGEIIYTKA